MGRQPHQLVFDRFHPSVQVSLPGRQGRPGRQPPVGRDQFHHRLRPGQIQLAVKESSPGEFARARWPRPRGQQIQPPVAGQLHHVLPGIAVRRAKHQGHAVVDVPLLVEHMPIGGGVSLQPRQIPSRSAGPEHPGRHRDGLVPRQTDNAQPGGGGRGGNGGNGLAHESRLLYIQYKASIPARPVLVQWPPPLS